MSTGCDGVPDEVYRAVLRSWQARAGRGNTSQQQAAKSLKGLLARWGPRPAVGRNLEQAIKKRASKLGQPQDTRASLEP